MHASEQCQPVTALRAAAWRGAGTSTGSLFGCWPIGPAATTRPAVQPSSSRPRTHPPRPSPHAFLPRSHTCRTMLCSLPVLCYVLALMSRCPVSRRSSLYPPAAATVACTCLIAALSFRTGAIVANSRGSPNVAVAGACCPPCSEPATAGRGQLVASALGQQVSSRNPR